MTASWFETRLPTILSNYELPDIYNADEFGLYFQALPSKSLHLKDEKCIGGKFSKVRLTGLAAANANGEKLPMFIFGKVSKMLQKPEATVLPLQRAEKKLDGR